MSVCGLQYAVCGLGFVILPSNLKADTASFELQKNVGILQFCGFEFMICEFRFAVVVLFSVSEKPQREGQWLLQVTSNSKPAQK